MMYWDTSALVKHYVEESGSRQITQWQRSVRVSSVIAYVEMHSAFSRRRRSGHLTALQYRSAVDQFFADWKAYVRIPVHDDILNRAAHLIDRHALRALDALHLATALQLQHDTETPTEMISADAALLGAAAAEGLIVHRIAL
jgi:uncharacterized protein